MVLLYGLLGVRTYPGWPIAVFAIITIAWGTFVFLNPVTLIELLHRGEEKSAITRRYLDWNPWLSEPIFIRILGATMIGIAIWGLVEVLLR